ncbi:MAG: hypothetical protein ERJ67_03035 [Aphanocapsa feldmannii 277cV]|uniref:Uncharacterized protein n=1 Tax=Aphanocapsa feldmannii 277cV TaxID=2507553 RepID=A0A524RPT4_9CHRO|nr:MAG: hypothetical protein ERJ67_03035 [Aphanocapsa feldmannii 277cV]
MFVIFRANLLFQEALSRNDYTFDDSKSLDGDFFLGCPIDEDSESDLTDERLSRWVDQLKQEIPALS